MNLLKLKNKRAQEMVDASLRWILYLIIAAVVAFTFGMIIFNATR